VRTSQAESTSTQEFAHTIHSIDPFISVYESQSMTKRVDESPSAFLHATAAWLLGGFAVVAVVLSVIGLYAVIAYSVAQRTRELGIRIALGAERGAIQRLVLMEAGRVGALGIACGMAFSIPAASLVRALLFGIRSWDIPTFVTVTGALTAASLLAAYLPARRAASVHPIEALRTE
jgi:ABC-type antimicrobial peptide transport system permease subunit